MLFRTVQLELLSADCLGFEYTTSSKNVRGYWRDRRHNKKTDDCEMTSYPARRSKQPLNVSHQGDFVAKLLSLFRAPKMSLVSCIATPRERPAMDWLTGWFSFMVSRSKQQTRLTRWKSMSELKPSLYRRVLSNRSCQAWSMGRPTGWTWKAS